MRKARPVRPERLHRHPGQRPAAPDPGAVLGAGVAAGSVRERVPGAAAQAADAEPNDLPGGAANQVAGHGEAH